MTNSHQEKKQGTHSAPTNRLSAAALKGFLRKQWQYRKEQLEFGFGAPHRQDILSKIRKRNTKLKELLEGSERLVRFKESKRTTSSPKAGRLLLQYSKHADRVHELLSHSFGCLCKDKHCARLWLQHRTSPSFEFKILMLWAPRALRGQQLPPWDMQGLLITWEAASGQLAALPTIRAPTHAGASCPPTAEAKLKSGKKRRVGFAGIL